MAKFKLFDIKGDLFATTSCFFAQGVIKLGSSVILTRILRPEDYGVITILLSILFVVEMIADIGVNIFIIRDKNGEDPRFLNNAWTLRLSRAALNSVILFVCAPVISSVLYHAPALTGPLRVISIWFIIAGLESMAFPLAIRRKQSRIIMYTELAATILANTFAVIYCHYSRDYWGILYSVLLHRLIMTVISYQLYRDLRPKLQFDWSITREIFKFTKFAMPSSMLTLGLSQFDKMVFLRLFDLQLLGVYGLANNIAAPIESLISKISQMVLYPRCAHNFRTNQETYSIKYYVENTKLFFTILIMPAAIGGASHLLVAVLYPARYALAGSILQAFMVRAALLSLASPAEDLLIAAGEYQVILIGNVFRALWLFAGSLAGYYFFGLLGFAYGAALSGLPPLIYYLWLQRKKGMLMAKYEIYKVAFICVVATSAYIVSGILMSLWPQIHRI